MFVKFASLPVQDQDRAISFYREHFDMIVAKDAAYGMTDGWRWVELAFDGARTHVLLEPRDGPEKSKKPNMVIVVKELRALYERMLASGVEFTAEPKPAPWNANEISALFYDTEGNLILLTEVIG